MRIPVLLFLIAGHHCCVKVNFPQMHQANAPGSDWHGQLSRFYCLYFHFSDGNHGSIISIFIPWTVIMVLFYLYYYSSDGNHGSIISIFIPRTVITVLFYLYYYSSDGYHGSLNSIIGSLTMSSVGRVGWAVLYYQTCKTCFII